MVGVTGAVGSMTTLTWYPVTISNQSIFQLGSPFVASYKLNNDGTVKNHNNSLLETWLLTGSASGFEARVTVTSGALSSGTVGSWVNLGTSQTWSRSSTGETIFLVEIRDAATLTVQDSATITLTVDPL